MTPTLTAWLLGSVAIGALFTLIPARTLAAVAFAGLLPLTYQAAQLPLGYADYGTPQAGRYTVLGARIDEGVAIYALLDSGKGEPHYYRLPYSAGDAKDLQEAMDLQVGGGAGVQADIGSDGEPGFHVAPVTNDQNKVAETPVIGG